MTYDSPYNTVNIINKIEELKNTFDILTYSKDQVESSPLLLWWLRHVLCISWSIYWVIFTCLFTSVPYIPSSSFSPITVCFWLFAWSRRWRTLHHYSEQHKNLFALLYRWWCRSLHPLLSLTYCMFLSGQEMLLEWSGPSGHYQRGYKSDSIVLLRVYPCS